MASMREQAAAIDALVQQTYGAGEPGAAAIVVREGRPIYRGAVGMALSGLMPVPEGVTAMPTRRGAPGPSRCPT